MKFLWRDILWLKTTKIPAEEEEENKTMQYVHIDIYALYDEFMMKNTFFLVFPMFIYINIYLSIVNALCVLKRYSPPQHTSHHYTQHNTESRREEGWG